MRASRKALAGVAFVGMAALSLQSAGGAVTLTDTVGPEGKFAMMAANFSSTSGVPVKIVFGNLTAGTTLSLCLGTITDYRAGACPTRFSSSEGPGFNYLTMVEASQLNGKMLYVIRSIGTANAQFTMTVE